MGISVRAIMALVAVAMTAIHPVLAESPAKDESRVDPARFESEIAAFEWQDAKNTAPRDAVLFVGSSSIRMWPAAKHFPNDTVINRGFGGAHISDVVHFVDRIVLPYKPRAIVFYAGDNDIAAGKSPERVAADYGNFCDIVQSKLPGTPIIFISIKPSLARWSKWPAMREANRLIEDYSKSNDHLEYVDIAKPMIGAKGEPRKELFIADGLHLSEKGYRVWVDAVGPIVKKVAAAH